MENKYHYFVSGSVGVGKTSIINNFICKYGNELSLCVIKEYIDFDCNGYQKLEDWIEGRIKLIEFQTYIVEQFRKQLDTPQYRNSKFVLWERHPEEALRIFATDLIDEDRFTLEKKINELECEFNIPEINDCGIMEHSLKIPNYGISEKVISKIIYEEMLTNIFNDSWECTFIFIYIPEEFIQEQQRRIFNRNRPKEVETYKNLLNLQKLNAKYINFANTYLSGKYLTGSTYN